MEASEDTQVMDAGGGFRSFDEDMPYLRKLLSHDAFEADEKSMNRVALVLSMYQEKPELLDQHLRELVDLCLALIRSSSERNKVDCGCQVLYLFCKVRGAKVIRRLLPHAAPDLAVALQLLQQDAGGFESWKTRYVALVWLSILVLLPFELDSVVEGLLPTLLQQGKMHLVDVGVTSDAAAMMISRLLSRPDMVDTVLPTFLDWSQQRLHDPQSTIFQISGVMRCLIAILKTVSRDSVFGYLGRIREALPSSLAESQSSVLRLLFVKLQQRIAIAFLPSRQAAWRYQRGQRSLLHNLQPSTLPPDQVKVSNQTGERPESDQLQEDDEEEEDLDALGVPCLVIEQIVDHLLTELQDPDTIIRWSAAKGIGRLTMRLNHRMGDEVVGSVMEVLSSPFSSHHALHGACLALAELARRGLLLPTRLPTVVPMLTQALVFEEASGASSVGANVRDAACYVCWAFARAYTADVMADFVNGIASGLLTVACFDREVNVRRAACAAFQESVGRQGNFPHGISLNTTADYFTVGNRNNAFLKVAPVVAQYAEYGKALIDHLVSYKLGHWDESLRLLASCALSELVEGNEDYFLQQVLPKLIPLTLSADLAERHGALSAIAEVLLRFSKLGLANSLSEQLQKDIRNLVPRIEKARLYRGRGGQIMRGASCRLIECIALAHLPLQQKAIVRLQQSISENLIHPNDAIQQRAVDAFRAISLRYYVNFSDNIFNTIVQPYIDALLRSENVASRRGHALALGALPIPFLKPQLLSSLLCSAVPSECVEADAETRKNCITALSELSTRLDTRLGSLSVVMDEGQEPMPAVDAVFNTFVAALDDYATDNRGDVGSWVRIAAMKAFQTYVPLAVAGGMCDIAQLTVLVSALLKQAVEKINRVRECAITVLRELLSLPHLLLQDLPHYDMLQTAISATVDWSSEASSFSAFVPLLKAETYRRSIFSGLVLTVGGVTDSLVQVASKPLLQTLQESDISVVLNVLDISVDMFATFRRELRVLQPLVKTVTLLLSTVWLVPSLPLDRQTHIGTSLLDLVRSEFQKTASLPLRIDYQTLIICLLSFSDRELQHATMGFLLRCLGWKFPRAREHCAEKLYNQLLSSGGILGISEHRFEAALEILIGTDWKATPSTMREQRLQLFDLFEIERPKLKAVTKPVIPTPSKNEDLHGYSDFIHDLQSGY